MSIAAKAAASSRVNASGGRREDSAARTRIMDAAFATFVERGFAAASTLEIATLARVSKRELYSLVGNKQQMLVACIGARARRLLPPGELPAPGDRETLAKLLGSFGAQLLREITDPTVIAVFRLAIAEAVNSPQVARVLDAIGRETSRTALARIMTAAQSAGVIEGQPVELAEEFSALLWGTLMISLLLGVVERPDARSIGARARGATAAFLRLHSPPG